MKGSAALAGGFAGACVVTLIHEGLRRVNPDAPRMDLLGMEALKKGLKSIDVKVPERDELFEWTMGGDIISNTLYYSAAGVGNKKSVWLRGALLGLAAGVGAVVLPKPLGLSESPSNRTVATKLMTVGLYLIGGLVTAAVTKLMDDKQRAKEYVEDEINWAMDY